ncbi:RNA polymerase sigma factor [Luteithermobacter gelatinilyticus]|uniref:RNA polymerase sigma factor n=1 Tax=Luteithermobacter gelatinilyticus TaxID=2582913 RepID=UPI00143D18CC|nr:sigma-70 family RNA polymerase sigma factor [Luteithermobacter gelatinilyticus]
MAAGIKNKDLDDETLAREMRAGSHGAFEEIMRRYKARLYAFICRYVTDREEAYDLLQETFVSIYEKIHLYDPSRRFSTWAFQIALNKCRDWGRKNTLRRFISFTAYTDTDEAHDFLENVSFKGAGPDKILDDKMELQKLARSVARLPDKLKTPFILCVLQDMPQEECAQILGVTTKTVETRIYRARKKLVS